MDTFRALQYSYIFKGHLTIDDKRGEGVWSETPKLADMIVNRAKDILKQMVMPSMCMAQARML